MKSKRSKGLEAPVLFIKLLICGLTRKENGSSFRSRSFRKKGIGLSIVRNIIGDGGDWGEAIDGPTPSIQPEEGVWNWSGDEDQIPLMKAAAQRGCTRFVSTAWSPPAWMKTKQCGSRRRVTTG